MTGSATLFSLLLVVIVSVLAGFCHSFQMYPSMEERQIFRHDADTKPEAEVIPRIASGIFDSDDENDKSSRLQEDSDSPLTAEELSFLEMSQPSQQQQLVKRRKGPTLSVVNPLEILRQRLMLDLARRRIQENQQQIVANAQLLENIGKRSGSGHVRNGNYQP